VKEMRRQNREQRRYRAKQKAKKKHKNNIENLSASYKRKECKNLSNSKRKAVIRTEMETEN
jgi:hypothetical protein